MQHADRTDWEQLAAKAATCEAEIKYNAPLSMSTHMAAKCHRSPPPSHPPNVIECEQRRAKIGDASYICQPDTTITLIAAVLVQCMARSQVEWMILLRSVIVAFRPLKAFEASDETAGP